MFLRVDGPVIFLTLSLLFLSVLAFESQAVLNTFELVPTETHHIVELNSDQPYVAGYDVLTPDLHTMRPVSAVTITVSFPSTDPSYFPSDGWLGAGMFVQDQDSHFGHVDYGFYVMLVLDAEGDLFFDVGLHQTRESTAPFQMATEELLYAYTWRVLGVDYVTPVTLGAGWDSEKGFVHYSVVANGFNVTLSPVNVAGLPNCENIHRQFWSGNFGTGPFPFGHYVYYFQFGVVSPTVIADDHWFAELSNPRLMKKPEGVWRSVDLALSTQGHISYLDYDWMWGGAPYTGVSAQYYKNPLEDLGEVIFFYNGQTLQTGTILWQSSSLRQVDMAESTIAHGQTFRVAQGRSLSIGIVVVASVTIGAASRRRLQKRKVR